MEQPSLFFPRDWTNKKKSNFVLMVNRKPRLRLFCLVVRLTQEAYGNFFLVGHLGYPTKQIAFVSFRKTKNLKLKAWLESFPKGNGEWSKLWVKT